MHNKLYLCTTMKSLLINLLHICLWFLGSCWLWACDVPVMSVQNAGHTYANISWTTVPSALSYDLRLREMGTSDWIELSVSMTELTLYLTPCTSYELQVRANCLGDDSSLFSSTQLLTTNGCGQVYCASYGSNTNYEWIDRVEIGAFANVSGINYGYGDYTTTTLELNVGSTYTIDLVPAFSTISFTQYWRVWLDVNGDGDFNDVGELLLDIDNATALPVSSAITIPTTATTGVSTLRIAMKSVDAPTDLPPLPCENFTYGEVEDYKVQVTSELCLLADADFIVAGASCAGNDGVATVVPENLTLPISYVWSNEQVGQTANNLSPGIYTVTITDDNDCLLVREVNVSGVSTPNLVVENIVQPACGQNIGSIEVLVQNGEAPFTFGWSHDFSLNSSIATNLPPDTYTVTVSDANDCVDVLPIALNNGSTPTIALNTVSPPNCGSANGFISLGTSGGTGAINYNWSHDPNLSTSLALNLSAGVYTITVSDDNNCTDVETINLVAIGGPVINVTGVQNTCFGSNEGSISIEVSNATGTVDYSWSHNPSLNSAIATNLSIGTYTVTVTDDNNCIAIEAINLPTAAAPLVQEVAINPATCNQANGSIFLSEVLGTNVNYTWSHNSSLNSALANGLSAGIYTVTLSSNDCNTTETYEVSALETFDYGTSSASDLCAAGLGSAAIIPTGNLTDYNYTWSHNPTLNSYIANNLMAGVYSVTATNTSTTCSVVESFIIDNESTLTGAFFSTVTPTSCGFDNGVLGVSTTGTSTDLSYSWDGLAADGPVVGNLSAGEYSVTISDNYGCWVSASTIIPSSSAIDINAEVQQASCGTNNGSISLNISPATDYDITWSTGSSVATLNGLAPNNYIVTVTDANDCSNSAAYTIVDLGLPVITIDTIVPAACGPNSGAIGVSVSGGQAPYTFFTPFESNNSLATNLSAGTYSVLVSDANNCVAENVLVEVPFVPSPTIELIAVDAECGSANGAVLVSIDNATPPLSYNWSNGFDSIGITDLLPDTYTVTITDAYECAYVYSVEVGELPPPSVNLGDDLIIDANESFILDATNDNATYLWSTGDTTPNISIMGANTYSVTVTSGACVAIDSVTVAFTALPATTLAKVLEVYPNPVKQQLFITFKPSNIHRFEKLIVTDINGCNIYQSNTFTPVIEVKDWPVGVYILHMHSNKGSYTQKIVKQ